MRTPLSGGLAAASLGLLVAGLALRSWQLVLLALPPVIVLALGSLFPPARPRLTAVRTLSRDRAEAGRDVDVHLVVQNTGPALDLVEIVDVLPREFAVLNGTNHAVVSLERGGSVPLSYPVRAPVQGDFRIGPGPGRALRVVHRHGDGQPDRARRPGRARDRGARPRVEESRRPDRPAGGPRLGAPRVRAEATVPDPGPPHPCAARGRMALRTRCLGPLPILSAGLPDRPHLAPPGPSGAERADRDVGSRLRRRDRLSFSARD